MLYAPCFMNIHQQVESDLRVALKSGDKEKAGILRFLIAALKNHQIEIKAKGEDFLADEETVAVVRRQIKQRKDSISEYQKGGRTDLVENEEKDLAILQNYAPDQMDEGKLREIVKAKMAELGVSDKSGFGKLMGAVMKETKGQAEGDIVKKIVEEELNAN